MGLNLHICRLDPSSDWPIRLLYGLVTAYQGLFGVLMPGTLFFELWSWPAYATVILSILLATGLLLIADSAMAMLRYCTDINCRRIRPAMRVFQRRRPWLFLPPVFCYFTTLSLIERTHTISILSISYYVILAILGIVFSLRDGLVGQEFSDD